MAVPRAARELLLISVTSTTNLNGGFSVSAAKHFDIIGAPHSRGGL